MSEEDPRLKSSGTESNTLKVLKDPTVCPQLKMEIVTTLHVYSMLPYPSVGYASHMTGLEEGLSIAARHPEIALKILEDIKRIRNNSEIDEQLEKDTDEVATAGVPEFLGMLKHYALHSLIQTEEPADA